MVVNFFIFSVNDKKSVVYGLLRFARNDEGGEWGFMDCHEPSVLAMTKRDESSEFFFFSVFVLTFCGLWIATGLRPSQ